MEDFFASFDLQTFLNSFEFQAMLRLFLGFILAGIIGSERESLNKPAGFKTHALIGISSVLVMLCGEYLAIESNVDISRIPAQLLSGIGFIGAGTILRDGLNVKGLTTAASLLAVTCIGLSIGAGFYLGGIASTIIVYFVLSHSHKWFPTPYDKSSENNHEQQNYDKVPEDNHVHQNSEDIENNIGNMG